MIRQATDHDMEGIEATYHEHFEYELKHEAYTIFKKDVYPTRKDIEKDIHAKTLYIYEDNHIIVGSVIVDHVQPEEYTKINWG